MGRMDSEGSEGNKEDNKDNGVWVDQIYLANS